jgi:hypothetical protein
VAPPPAVAADRQRLHVAGADRAVPVQEPALHHRDVADQLAVVEHERV